MDHILYQMLFCIRWYSVYSVSDETGNYLELLTPKIMKLLGSTKNEITKDKNGENKYT